MITKKTRHLPGQGSCKHSRANWLCTKLLLENISYPFFKYTCIGSTCNFSATDLVQTQQEAKWSRQRILATIKRFNCAKVPTSVWCIVVFLLSFLLFLVSVVLVLVYAICTICCTFSFPSYNFHYCDKKVSIKRHPYVQFLYSILIFYLTH